MIDRYSSKLPQIIFKAIKTFLVGQGVINYERDNCFFTNFPENILSVFEFKQK